VELRKAMSHRELAARIRSRSKRWPLALGFFIFEWFAHKRMLGRLSREGEFWVDRTNSKGV
jgi:hypothetical protein